jgi:hypothetical protein
VSLQDAEAAGAALSPAASLMVTKILPELPLASGILFQPPFTRRNTIKNSWVPAVLNITGWFMVLDSPGASTKSLL